MEIGFVEVISEFLNGLPTWVLLVSGIFLWVGGCVIAINIAFGANSLFMYQQLVYATSPVIAPPLFFIGWLLWPIVLPLFYIVFTLFVAYKDIWNTIKHMVIRICIWTPVALLTLFSFHLMMLGVTQLW